MKQRSSLFKIHEECKVRALVQLGSGYEEEWQEVGEKQLDVRPGRRIGPFPNALGRVL